MLPHFDFSNPEKAARRKWKYEDPKFDKFRRREAPFISGRGKKEISPAVVCCDVCL
jgi:hypothetical protein